MTLPGRVVALGTAAWLREAEDGLVLATGESVDSISEIAIPSPRSSPRGATPMRSSRPPAPRRLRSSTSGTRGATGTARPACAAPRSPTASAPRRASRSWSTAAASPATTPTALLLAGRADLVAMTCGGLSSPGWAPAPTDAAEDAA